MKNYLLLIIAFGFSYFGFSQASRAIKKENVDVVLNTIENAQKASSSSSCDTLYNFNLASPSTTITIYTLNTSSVCTGGYVVGNNCYGDVEKANYYLGNYNALLSPSVTGCYAFFYKSATSGKGTKGVSTHTMGINIYNGNMSVGPTGSALGSTSANMGSILSAFTSTSSLGRYTFNFANPVSLSGSGFFVSAVLPNITGDTAVIWQQYQATTTSGWDRDAGNTWYEMKTAWGGTINYELCLFPILGCSGFAGITEKDLDNFFKVVPNPSTGIINLLSTISGLSYDVNVTDVLGKSVYSKKYDGEIVNEINLSNCTKGVYFITVTSQSKSIVKKIILE